MIPLKKIAMKVLKKMNEQNFELHVIVKGAVQGVGFRATTRKLALQLDLVGSARNLSDGSVEIYAQGKKETLEMLIKNLEIHFGSDCIESMQVNYGQVLNHFKKFTIVI
jgi:acylphosphatase